jgi:iron complex outermembrane recepter protein
MARAPGHLYKLYFPSIPPYSWQWPEGLAGYGLSKALSITLCAAVGCATPKRKNKMTPRPKTSPLRHAFYFLPLSLLLPATSHALLEEVIVTAQKREENVQTVPVAVSVFSEEAIRQSQILTMDDVARQAPGFTVTNYNPVTPQPFMRGVGSSPSDAGSDASVGVFIDGVYAGRAGGYRADLFDVERVEVLRGPQGTLFGRNVAGGALNIFTNKPSRDFGANLEVTGGNYSLVEARGMVTGSIAPELDGRLAFATRERDGHTDNTVTGSELRDEDNKSVRGRLLWAPSEVLTALFTADYSEDDYVGPAARNYVGPDPAGILAGINPLLGALAPLLLPSSEDEYDVEAGVDGVSEREMSSATMQLDWDLDIGTLTAISSYRESDYYFFDDLLGLAFDPASGLDPLLTTDADEESSQFSQEIRLNSVDGEMEWTVGLYYLYEDVERLERFTPLGSPVAYDQDSNTTSYAAFGQLTYPFSDVLSVTLGGRYSYDEKDFDLTAEGTEIGFGLLTPSPEDPAAGAVGFTSSDDDSWTNFSPSVSLEYTPDDNNFIYLTVSQGYKSGGYNGNSTNEVAGRTPFSEEQVTNYEAGIKTDFLDRKARLNVAAFYMDYEDLQVFITSAETTAGLFVDNAAEADISGFEAEFFYSPNDDLLLTLTYAYLDAELGQNDIPEADDGNTLTRSPEHAASAAAQYSISIDGVGELTLRADYTWQDKIYFLLNNPELSAQESYGLLNSRISLQSDDGWELALWAKNIADEDYWVHAIDPSYGSDLASSGIQGDPRMYGATVRYQW